MLDQQALPAPSIVSDSLVRQLDVIEMALAAGDVAAARRHLHLVRRSLHDETVASEAGTIVGGIGLTGQEIASLRLLPDGSLSQKDIARAMGVTRNTLKTHLKSLYLKLGVHCRSEAINRARELGLLPRPLTLVTSVPRSDERSEVCA
ncbi:helix-turn-helix transcriptional regulator [Ilumatobacter sp.]|uniref:helix-turn-helix transcriptional regulator n=1 Tax=Ilumatobacter sp. TaxID=1967498 RepID=UPI003AF79D76